MEAPVTVNLTLVRGDRTMGWFSALRTNKPISIQKKTEIGGRIVEYNIGFKKGAAS